MTGSLKNNTYADYVNAPEIPLADQIAQTKGQEIQKDYKDMTDDELFPDSTTYGDLMKKNFAPLFQPVEGLIVEGYTILAGGSKIGKSWLMLDLAYSVAHGLPFLGKSTNKCPVLYYALEDSERRIKDRNMKMGLPENYEDDSIRYVFKTQKIDEDFCQRVSEWLKRKGGRCLVIVDVLQKIRGKAKRSDGDAYQTDYRVTEPIGDLARKYNSAIVCVHHTNKDMTSGKDVMRKINGSTGIPGAADTIIVIDKESGTNSADVDIRSREIPESCFEIRMDDHCRWSAITEEAVARERYEKNPIIQPIRDLFKDYPNGGKISYSDFVSRCCGRFPYTDNRSFSRALSGGLASDLLRYDGIVIETGAQTGQGKDHSKAFTFRKSL